MARQTKNDKAEQARKEAERKAKAIDASNHNPDECSCPGCNPYDRSP